MTLEKDGEGTNLSIQVLDGILCHNGEFALGKYEPKSKTKATKNLDILLVIISSTFPL